MSPDLSVSSGDYPENVKIVGSLREVFETAFDAQHNVVLMPRQLHGDFGGLARTVLDYYPAGSGNLSFGWMSVRTTQEFFAAASSVTSPGLHTAFDHVLEDTVALEEAGYSTQIRVQNEQPPCPPHADGFDGRILVNYAGATTRGWRMHDIEEHSYFKSSKTIFIREGSTHFQLRLGDIWRQAGTETKQTKPFVHAVPSEMTEPRLLIVASPVRS